MKNHYELHVTIDPEAQHMSAEGTVYIALQPNTKQFSLYLYKDLEISSLDSPRVKSWKREQAYATFTSFIPRSTAITIELDEPIKKNERLPIQVSYEGQVVNMEMGVNRIDQSWTELGVYAPWFPIDDKFTPSKYDCTCTFTQPDIHLLGSTVSQIDAHTWSLQLDNKNPTPTILGSALFPHQKRSATTENFTFNVYYISPQHEPIASYLSEQADQILTYYTSTFGSLKQGQEKVDVVLVDRRDDQGGGYNRPGLVVLPAPDTPLPNGTLSQDLRRHYQVYLAHELAHNWWSKGDVLTWEDWLNESFAEYSASKAIQHIDDSAHYLERIQAYERHSKDLPCIRGLRRDHPVAHKVLYSKGPYLLTTLEKTIGSECMMRFLKTIHESSCDNTSAVLSTLHEINPQGASLLNQWLDL